MLNLKPLSRIITISSREQGHTVEIEQIKAWAALMYREVDEQLDADWVWEQLQQQEEICRCEQLANPV